MDLFKSPWLTAFLIVAVVHLIFIGLDLGLWATVTKCLLAPLLAVWVIQQDGPWVLVIALVACFFGDLFLEFEQDVWFLVGMGAFAIAQISFISYFVKDGALSRLATHWWVALVLLAILIGVFAAIWNGLVPELRIAVPIYALLLATTGALALVTDTRAGIGAALFLFSDGVIALRLADIVSRDSIMASLVVMVTYILAIFLLATGIVDHEAKNSSIDSASGGKQFGFEGR